MSSRAANILLTGIMDPNFYRAQKAPAPDYIDVTDPHPAKRKRKCPMCGVMHYWSTEDKLCFECEGIWTDQECPFGCVE